MGEVRLARDSMRVMSSLSMAVLSGRGLVLGVNTVPGMGARWGVVVHKVSAATRDVVTGGGKVCVSKGVNTHLLDPRGS